MTQRTTSDLPRGHLYTGPVSQHEKDAIEVLWDHLLESEREEFLIACQEYPEDIPQDVDPRIPPHQILDHLLTWTQTPQGVSYWVGVAERLAE